jgi:threonine dehydratase
MERGAIAEGIRDLESLAERKPGVSTELAVAEAYADVGEGSGDQVAKLHVRHMVGGLERLGGRWSISLFHYRNHGADFGRVLAGFEVPDGDATEFAQVPRTLGYHHQREDANPAYAMFLGRSGGRS